MLVKVKKNISCPRGMIFTINDERTKRHYGHVSEKLSDGRLKMLQSGCSFLKGLEIELPPSAINVYGKAYFDRHFEILEGGPEVEAPQEEELPGDDLAEAMIKLMEQGKVSPRSGKPSCADISAILDREVSSKERDDMFAELEEK